MEKRVVFRSRWLPWVLIAPQVAVIAVFFFWPAAQALLQSVQQSDAFGTSVEWVGLDNFRNLWNDPTYLASFYTTALFSVPVAALGIGYGSPLIDATIAGAHFDPGRIPRLRRLLAQAETEISRLNLQPLAVSTDTGRSSLDFKALPGAAVVLLL